MGSGTVESNKEKDSGVERYRGTSQEKTHESRWSYMDDSGTNTEGKGKEGGDWRLAMCRSRIDT